MFRQSVFIVVISLLLVGLGFFLGQYFAVSRGMLWQAGKVQWSAADFSAFFQGREAVSDFSAIIGYNPPVMEDYIDTAEEESEDLYFPSKIGCLFLDKVISGKEALEHSEHILGAEAAIKRVFIPHYSNGDSQVNIWVFEMSSNLEARRYLEKINSYIEQSQIFEECGSFFLQNIRVFYLKGLGMDNYYYRKNNIIYWLSLVIDDPIPLFLQFYEHF